MENTSDNQETRSPSGPRPGGSDDEFANIPTRRGRHPALAVGAAVLAGILLWAIHDDVFYALRSSDPVELGDARVAVSGPGAADHINQLVRVRGTPDRESGLEIDTKGSWVFTQLFRILGTGDRMFVHRPPSPLPAEMAERDVFVGRLIRFKDLSFEHSIRDYFAARVTATHVFPVAELQRALAAQQAGGQLKLADMAGDEVVLGPKDDVTVSLARRDEFVVALTRERFKTEGDARAALDKTGAQVLRTADPEKERFTFVVRVPAEAHDQMLHKIGDIDMRGTLREARDSYKVPAAALRSTAEGLSLEGAGPGGAAVAVAAADVRTVRTVATVQIPPDAYLVQENDLPRDHWMKAVVAAVLLLFAFINIYGLVKGLRGEARKA